MNQSKPLIEVLPDIRMVREEIVQREGYFWDNRVRGADTGPVLQQTLSGSAFFETAEHRWEVPPGYAMLFRHGESSWYGCDAACARPYRQRWIHLTGAPGIHHLFEGIRSEFGPVVRMAEQGEAGQMVRRLAEEEAAGTRRDRLRHAESAYCLLVALYREQVAGRRGDDPVAYGRYLLETQYRSPRNLKEWAMEIGISREHFTREFRRRYGETPAAFLRRLRLEHARRLLGGHHLTLSDVAAASGFASAQTFHRAYRDHFGVPAGSDR